jgi:hypothetical protein
MREIPLWANGKLSCPIHGHDSSKSPKTTCAACWRVADYFRGYESGRRAGIEEAKGVLEAKRAYLSDSSCSPFQFKGQSYFDDAIKEIRALLEKGSK